MSIKIEPLTLCPDETKEDFLDRCYDLFRKDVFTQTESLVYNNKIIAFQNIEFIDGKLQRFMHISSLDRENGFDIFPCHNTAFNSTCESNCTEGEWSYEEHDSVRDICIYRASFVSIIKGIINLASQKDNRIKQWKECDPKTSKAKVFIRYTHENIDYIIILLEGKQKYYLHSAYPLFYRASKLEFERSYEKHKK